MSTLRCLSLACTGLCLITLPARPQQRPSDTHQTPLDTEIRRYAEIRAHECQNSLRNCRDLWTEEMTNHFHVLGEMDTLTVLFVKSPDSVRTFRPRLYVLGADTTFMAFGWMRRERADSLNNARRVKVSTFLAYFVQFVQNMDSAESAHVKWDREDHERVLAVFREDSIEIAGLLRVAQAASAYLQAAETQQAWHKLVAQVQAEEATRQATAWRMMQLQELNGAAMIGLCVLTGRC